MKEENRFAPYELQFNAKSRKELVAEMMRELRIQKGYQQKELSEILGISPQTYNGYEQARSEPPIELIVRLSFLYGVPVDMLVQRDRFSRMDESLMVSVNKYEDEIANLKKDFSKSPLSDNAQLNSLMQMMENMVDMMGKVVAKDEGKKYRK